MLTQPEPTPRILIVEDELIVSADIASRLKRMGYLITGQADSAENAINICAQAKPDLVLMDIRLKGAVDGITAADRIRMQHQIPVVFLTAHADEPTLQRAKVTEPYGYVLKPFEERELRIVVEMSLYRAQTQRQIMRNRDEMAAILNSIGDAVIATDHSGCVGYLNPVAERLTGAKQNEAHGMPLSEIATCHDLKTDAPLSLEQLVRTPNCNSQYQEVRLRTRTREEFTVIASVTRLPTADGQPPGNVVVFRDVSQHRKLEEELKQSQRMEALGLLAVGVAHDLNNILTVICVNHALLAESIPSQSKQYDLLDGISQATDRACKMTQQLLAIGKNQMIQPQVLDLDEVISESMPLLQRLLTKNIAWRHHPSNRKLPILADKNQVEQILLNLLVNARNAMPSGGVVTIRTLYAPDCNELQSLPHSSSTLTPIAIPSAILEVEDTGCGIDVEAQSRIWEPFYSSNERGIGLGLAVVYGAVKQANGAVSLISTPGNGTTFRVYLPLVESN